MGDTPMTLKETQPPPPLMKGVQTWTKDTWHTWLPGWIPICFTIIVCAICIGRYQKTIDDCVIAVKNLQADVTQIKADAAETKGYLKGLHEQEHLQPMR